MRPTIALLFAAAGMLAADYPRPVGYVNDFAGAVPEADRQVLESKLRAYEQSTSVEVVVAIVPSLGGQPVEDYARELFQAWNIGKRDQNNGVLFLWAPAERRVRIQVGYGLESALTDQAAAEILLEVTRLFRQREFSRGVYAAVYGIFDRLDHSSSSLSTIPVAALVAALAGLIGAIVMLQFRRHKTRELRGTLPGMLEACGRQVDRAIAAQPEALAGMSALRHEAPPEVWTGLDTGLADAPAKLAGLREDLAKISTHPRQQYGELREVESALQSWRASLAQVTAVFDRIAAALANFRDSRRAAQELMAALPEKMALCEVGGIQLMDAARETYAKAQAASVSPPVNWLLVHDLLRDAQDCVDRTQALARGETLGSRSRLERRWAGSELDSPAILMIDSMFPAVVDTGGGSDMSSSNVDAGVSSGGSDFGGFGGGDSGSGGASDSY